MLRLETAVADVSVVIRMVDSTDGTPETGVVAATAGLTITYRREGAAAVALTSVSTPAINDLALLTTAHTDAGLLHIADGYYRFDLPDAAVAAGVAGVMVTATATGMVGIGCYLQIGTLPVDLTKVKGTPLPAESVAGRDAAALGKFLDVASPTGTVNSLPDAVPGAENGLPTVGGSGYVTAQIEMTQGKGIGAVTKGTWRDLLYRIENDDLAAGVTDVAGDVYGKVLGDSATAIVGTGVEAQLPTGAITAATIADDAIDAASIKADAVTKIQNGLATAANQTTILARIGAFTGTGVNTIKGFLQALASKIATTPSDIGGTFNPATDSLEAIRERGDAAWVSGSGSGAISWPITIDDGTNPVDGAQVLVYTEVACTNLVASGYTDAFGVVTFDLDAGTYYARVQDARYNATNPTAFTVTP